MPILNPDYSSLTNDEMATSIGLKSKHIPILVGSFLEESQSILDSLESAIESKDFNEIRLQAHSIKGSAGNLKFNDIYEMAKEVELSASDSNQDFEYMLYLEAIQKAIFTIPTF